MKFWICRDESGQLEIIRTTTGNFRPTRALCEAPYDEAIGAVASLDYIQLKCFYFAPESSSKIDLSKITDEPPTFYFDFSTNMWMVSSGAIPEYWMNNGVWVDTSVTPPPEGVVPKSKRNKPEKLHEAVILSGARSSYLSSKISELKQRYHSMIERDYERVVSAVKLLIVGNRR